MLAFGSATAALTTESLPVLSLLLFALEREIYAVPSSGVRGVVRYREATPVPGAPRTLPGIISQRGVVMPVVELRALLGLEQEPLGRAARLVLLQHGEVMMALITEAVFDLVTLETTPVEPVPATFEPGRARLLRGIIQHEGHPVALLDMETLIAVIREEG